MAHDSYLSTHILDTARGRPGAGVTVELWRLEPDPQHIITTVTTKDGRNADPLLPEAGFIPGRYELRFHVGAYFADSRPGQRPALPGCGAGADPSRAGAGTLPRAVAVRALQLHDLSRVLSGFRAPHPPRHTASGITALRDAG